MLELGQPIHGYDLDTLAGGITVRRATRGREARDPRRQGARRSTPRTCSSPTTSGADRPRRRDGRRRRPRCGGDDRNVLHRGRDTSTRSRSRARRAGTSCRARRRSRFERGVDPALAARRGAARRRPDGRVRRRHGRRRGHRRRPRRPSRRRSRCTLDFAGAAHRRRLHGRARCVASLEAIGAAVERTADAARGHPADLAARPRPTSGPRRGGRPHRRLRPHPVGAARTPPAAAASPRPAAAPLGRRRARRARARRGADLPVRRRRPLDALGLPADDAAARAPCAWPTRCPTSSRCMRTSLLATLLDALRRNVGRGASDVGALRARPRRRARRSAARGRLRADRRRPAVRRGRSAAIGAAVPPQPRHVAVCSPATREPAGWWGAAARRLAPTPSSSRGPSRRPSASR